MDFAQRCANATESGRSRPSALRRIGTLCTEILHKRGRRAEVRSFCQRLDDDLMLAEVLALQRMNLPSDMPFTRIRRVNACGGECAERMWRWRWFAVELDDAEPKSFGVLLLSIEKLSLTLICARPERLVATVADDPQWASAAEALGASLAQRSLARAFFAQFPDRAPMLVGAMRMLFGGDSLPCDFCRPAGRRRSPRSCCPYCKATVEAALHRGRRLSPAMLAAEAARAVAACEIEDGSLDALGRAVARAEEKVECVYCGRRDRAPLVQTARGPICGPCVSPHASVEEIRDDGR